MEVPGAGRIETSSLVSIEDIFIELFGPIVGRSYDSPQLKFVCPLCGKKALSCNTEKGLYNCFRCGYGKGETPVKGKASKAKASPVDHAIQRSVLETAQKNSTIPASYANYLKARGIYNPATYGIFIPTLSLVRVLRDSFSEAELLHSGLFTREENGVLSLATCLGPGKIVIPYYEKGKIVACKSRNNPFFSSENSFKYTQPRGSLAASMIWHRTISDDVILTEGELKSIVALEHGLSCIASSGMNISSTALLYLDRLIRNARRLFIAYDRDKDSLDSLKIAKSIWHRYREKAAIVVFPSNGCKVDLDSFIMGKGVPCLLNLLESSWSNRLSAVELSTYGSNI